jgi:quercetin dioxygenase-like cupin family protein
MTTTPARPLGLQPDDAGDLVQKVPEMNSAQTTEDRMTPPSPFLPETETTIPIIHGPGSGTTVGVIGGRSTFKVLSAETGGAYALLEQEVPPGGGPPLHVHRHETEIFYILEGQFELTVGGQRMPAPPGTTATCPRDIPHTFRNVGTTPGKLLLTVIPGRFADYFLEVDGVPDHNREAIRALAAKYDVEILE